MFPMMVMPTGKRGKRAIAAAGAIGVAVTAVWWVVGSYKYTIPTPDAVIRIDLLATRDLDATTPCGLPAGGTSNTKPLVADQTWTRTGGKSCYPISATAAQCFDATEIPYTVDATGLGWVVDRSETNYVLQNQAIDCASWTCQGTASATKLQPSPDGRATASLITIGAAGNGIYYTTTNSYTPSTTTHPRLWLKCSAGSLNIWRLGAGATGKWSVNCATVGGAWTLINPTATAVAESEAWVAGTSGAHGFILFAASGTINASIWTPTITQAATSHLAVIPTAGASVSTGSAEWLINNTGGKYHRTENTLTQTITQHYGTCWVVEGSTLRMTGTSADPCSGVWYGLRSEGDGSTWAQSEIVILAGQSNMTSGATSLALPAEYQALPGNAYFYRNGDRKATVNWGTNFGPEAALMKALSAARPTRHQVYIKRDLGGSSLYAVWHPTQDAGRFAVTGEAVGDWQYDDLVNDINTLIWPGTPVLGLFWMQGERDTGYVAAAADYANGLDGLIAALEVDIGRQIPALVLGRIYDATPGSGYATVRAAQAAVGAQRPGGAAAAWIDTDALTRYDHVHLDYAAQLTLGASMFAAYQGL